MCFISTSQTKTWEQRKFGDIFEEYSEKKHEELPPLMVLQEVGTVKRDNSERSLQYEKSGDVDSSLERLNKLSDSMRRKWKW